MCLFLKMLIILEASVVSSPHKSVLLEESASEVVAVYLVFELSCTVSIWPAFLGTHGKRAVLAFFHHGVVERVDVNGGAIAVV